MNPSDSGSSAAFVQTPTPSITPPAQSGASTTWPGAFGIFAHSRDAVIRNLMNLILLFAFSVGASLISSQLQRHVDIVTGIVVAVIGLLASMLFSAALTAQLLYAARGETALLSKALNRGLHTLWKILVIDLVLGALIIVSLLLLVLPIFFVLIYVFPKLSLAHYFAVDETKDMDPFAAMAASWQATNGNFGKVWGIIGVTILILIPVVTLVGVLVTIPLLVLYSAAYAFLYLYATGSRKADGTAAPVALTAPTAP